MQKDYDPETGFKLINRYRIEGNLGRGVHGKVKLGRNVETGEYVAIKIVDRTPRKRLPRQLNPSALTVEQKIQREIAIFKKCAHPHVVKLMEVIDDPASRKIYMVLEYMEGGEIKWTNEQEQPLLPVNESREIFRDVVCGLEYLHYQGIIHRDIKPANLLLTRDRVVKISDFGVSHLSQPASSSASSFHSSSAREDVELANTAGSPAFFAPELCFPVDLDARPGTPNRPPITNAIDVWALGVTLYCLLYGKPPFMAANEYELFNIIPTQELEFPSPGQNGVSAEACDSAVRDLLHKLLTKDPKTRIKLNETKYHPWVVADLADPAAWREETDPKAFVTVEVTAAEIDEALITLWRDKLRGKLRKLSSSISNIVGLRRRSKSVSSELPSMKEESLISESRSTPVPMGTLLAPQVIRPTLGGRRTATSSASSSYSGGLSPLSMASTPAGLSPLQLAPAITIHGQKTYAVTRQQSAPGIGLGIDPYEHDISEEIEEDEIYDDQYDEADDGSDNEGDLIEIRSRSSRTGVISSYPPK